MTKLIDCGELRFRSAEMTGLGGGGWVGEGEGYIVLPIMRVTQGSTPVYLRANICLMTSLLKLL